MGTEMRTCVDDNINGMDTVGIFDGQTPFCVCEFLY